eukprot:m.477310 g.477310  ORF g.477310 m.477310 type:complete len:500 (-) comp20804_c0_seq1:66-1565(-)
MADNNLQRRCKSIVEALKGKHVRGRRLCELFLRLPTRKQMPLYYEFVKSPIDIMSIEKKIRAKEYVTMALLEKDLRLMFANARLFNEPRSQVHRDANTLETLMVSLLSEDAAQHTVGSKGKKQSAALPTATSRSKAALTSKTPPGKTPTAKGKSGKRPAPNNAAKTKAAPGGGTSSASAATAPASASATTKKKRQKNSMAAPVEEGGVTSQRKRKRLDPPRTGADPSNSTKDTAEGKPTPRSKATEAVPRKTARAKSKPARYEHGADELRVKLPMASPAKRKRPSSSNSKAQDQPEQPIPSNLTGFELWRVLAADSDSAATKKAERAVWSTLPVPVRTRWSLDARKLRRHTEVREQQKQKRRQQGDTCLLDTEGPPNSNTPTGSSGNGVGGGSDVASLVAAEQHFDNPHVTSMLATAAHLELVADHFQHLNSAHAAEPLEPTAVLDAMLNSFVTSVPQLLALAAHIDNPTKPPKAAPPDPMLLPGLDVLGLSHLLGPSR